MCTFSFNPDYLHVPWYFHSIEDITQWEQKKIPMNKRTVVCFIGILTFDSLITRHA